MDKDPRIPDCSGTVYIGMFFDGTGNNEKADYLDVLDEPAKHKHTNVVRLYHAYPDEKRRGTDGYYRFYIPGVGTSFPEINDLGVGDLKLGAMFALSSESRMIWGLTRVFNALSVHVTRDELIDNSQSGAIAQATNSLYILGSPAWQRHLAFKTTWQPRLVEKLRNMKPHIGSIVIDVFGFSRGAAQARAWVNWLYALCEKSNDSTPVYRFAGIPLRVRFMGLFDTVASVGASNLVANKPALDLDGHMSWAANNLQIPPQVTRCVHFVAAHEVRASFPSDSVREDGVYPPNVREVVYPGAHSDVGGGYLMGAQGKSSTLARIPGHAMYLEALAAGVPLRALYELTGIDKPILEALIPPLRTVEDFNAYQAQMITTGLPVKAAHRKHMAQYFSYRHQAGQDYARRPFFERAKDSKERAYLLRTQENFLYLLEEIAKAANGDVRIGHRAFDTNAYLVGWEDLNLKRVYLSRPLTYRDARAQVIHWREKLAAQSYAELIADAPHIDAMSVLDDLSLSPLNQLPMHFFDWYVHDSMAGFMESVNEFSFNGRGLFKHRRIFFGDGGDRLPRATVAAENARRVAKANEARAQRSREQAQRAQWDREAAEFDRTRQR